MGLFTPETTYQQVVAYLIFDLFTVKSNNDRHRSCELADRILVQAMIIFTLIISLSFSLLGVLYDLVITDCK